MKKWLSFALAAIMSFGFAAGCAKTNEEESSVQLIEVDEMLPAEIEGTGKYVVENGKSDYTIVLPADAGQLLQSVATDVQNFLFNASGAMLPIQSDSNYTFNEEDKVIAIGDTAIWRGSGLELTNDMLDTGYIMKRFGNTVVCNAKNPLGAVSAAYDMLHYLIDYEFYAMDEIYYRQAPNVELLDFNLKFIPTVDIRHIMSEALDSNIIHRQRLKLLTEYNAGCWITFAHTVISEFLPTSTYQVAKPEWYNSAGTQVCYSNDEMRAEMVKQIKDRIEGHPDGTYIMIGHEDNHDMCECYDCVEAREKFGGYSGQEVDFANKISMEMEDWLKANYPDANYKFVVFAYQTSASPPAKFDEAQNKYVATYENFSVRDDVMVLYCPIEADFSAPFNSEANDAMYQQLKGWFDIFEAAGTPDNICIWTYSIRSKAYLVPGNIFGVFGEHYKTMADCGVSFIMDQYFHDSRVPCFEEMTLYVHSNLMYRSDLSYSALVKDFIEHYYGEAADVIYDYYEYYRAYYAYIAEEKAFGGGISFEAQVKEYWPLEVVNELISMLDKAVEAIQPLQESDPERYVLLYNRIMKEKITPLYLILLHHMTALTQEKKEQYWSEINTYTVKYGILNTMESRYDLAGVIEEWRLQIFG